MTVVYSAKERTVTLVNVEWMMLGRLNSVCYSVAKVT